MKRIQGTPSATWGWVGTYHVALTLALTVACATLFRAPKPPPPRDEIIFSHDFHTSLEFVCADCHADVERATSLDQVRLPGEATCLECHQERKDGGDCAFCHTQPQRPASYPHRDSHLVFSHVAHAPRRDCAGCHPRLPEPGTPPVPPPTMASCLSCHEHQAEYDDGGCARCHSDLARFPLDPVAEFAHEGDFARTHGASARASAASCASCHEQTFCADCHANTVAAPVELRFPDEVDRRFIHRGDYVVRHALDAASDPALCQRCHGVSFCSSCHETRSLTPVALHPRNPHPPGWAFPGAAEFHGDAARRDATSCASCHDQGARSSCVDCHRVGGIGGNPHPPGWSDRHDRAEIAATSMCLYCH